MALTIRVVMAVTSTEAPPEIRLTPTNCMEPANTSKLMSSAHTGPNPASFSRMPNPMPRTIYPAITGRDLTKAVFTREWFTVFTLSCGKFMKSIS